MIPFGKGMRFWHLDRFLVPRGLYGTGSDYGSAPGRVYHGWNWCYSLGNSSPRSSCEVNCIQGTSHGTRKPKKWCELSANFRRGNKYAHSEMQAISILLAVYWRVEILFAVFYLALAHPFVSGLFDFFLSPSPQPASSH